MSERRIVSCIVSWGLAVILAVVVRAVVAAAAVSCPCWDQQDLEEAVLDTCAGADQAFCEHTTVQVGVRLGCVNSSLGVFGDAEAVFRPRPTEGDVGVCVVNGFGLPSAKISLTAAETGVCIGDLARLCPQIQ